MRRVNKIRVGRAEVTGKLVQSVASDEDAWLHIEYAIVSVKLVYCRTATGGIALFSTIGSLGGFLGPSLFGALKQGSGDYATSMAAAALGLVLAALIVLAVGRAMVPRPVLVAPRAGAAE